MMERNADPGAAAVPPPVETQLAELDRDQLIQVLLALVAEDSALVGRINGQIKRLKSAAIATPPAATTGLPPRPEIQLDIKKTRREVRSALRDAYGSSYSSWGSRGGIPDLGAFLAQAQELIRAGQGNLALDVLEAVTGEYAENIDDLADEEGETGDLIEHELAPLWTEAVLTAKLTAGQRKDWASKFDTWDSELSNYGYDDAFTSASAALTEGWTNAALQRALRGEQQEWRAWAEQNPNLDQVLITARLNVLERQGRLAEALNLAQAAGQSARYASLLLQLGRVPEAVDAARQHFTTAAEALAFARELREKWHAPEAASVAERGLALEGPKGELAGWLTDLASELGRDHLAISAAVIGFKAQPELLTFQRVQRLAGPRWPEYREELLAYLRQTRVIQPAGPVEVFLHEQLIDDAIAAVEGAWSYDTIERVARAAVETRPEWVVQTCRSQAERIMDAGKAESYHHAVDWLAIARDAYRALGQSAEWTAYLSALIDQHARKYKLRPMLERLR